jgi:hypothetical protein
MLTNQQIGILALCRVQLSLVRLYDKVGTPEFEALREINKEIAEAVKLLER